MSKMLIWFAVIVLFVYAVAQLLRLVRQDMQDKKNQHKKLRENVTRRAREPVRESAGAEKASKKGKMDFSAFRPPQDAPDVLDALASTAPEQADAAVDLLAVYDQVSDEFAQAAPDAAVQDDAELAPMPLFEASDSAEAAPVAQEEDALAQAALPEEALEALVATAPLVEEGADSDPYATVAPARPLSDADDSWADEDLQEADALLLEEVVVPGEPREADELVLFSADGTPPQTIWSRNQAAAEAEAATAPEAQAAIDSAAGEAVTTATTATAGEADAPPPEPDSNGAAAAADENGFSLELELRQFRRELARIRGEMADYRNQGEAMRNALGKQVAENDVLRDEMKQVREQMQTLLNGQGVSPEYKEAIVLARSGMGVEELAQRCSISIAEAQLVCSLATGGAEKSGEAT